jgi:dTMP kinase
MFVVVEGVDGSGKTTAVEGLVEALRVAGVPVVGTGEPGGSPNLGSEVSRLLLHTGHYLTPRAEALLFAADRAQHVNDVIAPALREGKVVVCSRFVDSTLAYQGAGRGLNFDDLLAISDFAADGLKADLVLVLDVDPDTAKGRQETRGEADRIEAMDMGGDVRRVLLGRVEGNPETYRVVDASRKPSEVVSEMARLVSERMREMANSIRDSNLGDPV